MKPSPVLAGMGAYPFTRLAEEKRRLLAAGRRPRRLRRRRAARGDAGASSATRSPQAITRALHLPARRGPARDCARRSRAGSERRFGVAAGPGHARSCPTLGSKEAIFHLAAGRRAATSWRCTTPAYPVPARGAAFAGRGVLELPLRAGDRLPARPRRGRRGHVGPRRRAVPELPEQPDGRDRPARALRGAPPRWPAATTSCWPPTRPTPSCTSAPSRPPRRCSSPTGATWSRSTRSPSARRCRAYRCGFVAGDPEVIAALKRYRPNVGTAPPEFVQRAADRGLGRRGARRGDAGRLSRQARRAAARARGRRPAARGRRRDVLPVARRRPGGRRARRPPARGGASCWRRARSSGRPARATCALALVPELAACERAAQRLPALLRSATDGRAGRRSGRPTCPCAAAPRRRRSASCAGTAARGPAAQLPGREHGTAQ